MVAWASRLFRGVSEEADLRLLALGGLLLWLGVVVLENCQLAEITELVRRTYIVIRLLVVIAVVAHVILVLIVLIIELALLEVIIHLLKLKSLSSEPVDGTWNELLLDVLAELVVELQALLDVGGGIVIILLSWDRWWGEEVEERLGWDGLLDDAGLLGVYVRVST